MYEVKDFQVVKIGSNSFFDANDNLDESLLEQKVREIEKDSINTVLVLSGAIKLGKKRMGDCHRKNSELTYVEKQSYASIGQPILNDYLMKVSARPVAQVLVTIDDLQRPNDLKELCYSNAEKDVLTVINSNDTTDWIGAGKDNDTLGASVAIAIGANGQIIYTDIDGFYDDSKKIISHVPKITQMHYGYCKDISTDGTGGMPTKLDSGVMLNSHDMFLLLANISSPLTDVKNGKAISTYFGDPKWLPQRQFNLYK